jgi:MFS family permease
MSSPRTSYRDEEDLLINNSPTPKSMDNEEEDDDEDTSVCECNQHVVALLILSGSFFCLFAPFSAIQNLESSLNASDKLGATAIATLYLVYTVGCLLAPAVVGTFGPTRSMIGAGSFVCLFIAAHFHPTWRSLIPASILVGLGCAFMWAAQGVYITRIAVNYAESTGAEKFAYLGLFNGIFWGLFNCKYMKYI